MRIQFFKRLFFKYWPVIFAAACLYLGYFFRFKEFGLYEDDFNFIAIPINTSTASELIQSAYEHIIAWPEGRPIGFAVVGIFATLTEWIWGQLWAQYVTTFSILSFCLLVIYRFCLRVSSSRLLSFLVIVIYALWPADTNKAFLTHAYAHFLSVTFIILFADHYFQGNKLRALVYYAVSLLIYEHTILAAFAVPLVFAPRSQRGMIRKWISVFKDEAVIFLIASAYLLVRISVVGEPRILKQMHEGGNLFAKLGNCLVAGPIALLSAPFQFRRVIMSPEAIAIGAGVFVILGWILLYFVRADLLRKSAAPPAHARSLIQLGILIVFLTYPLYSVVPEHYPPDTLVGRMNAIHNLPSLGWALIASTVLALIIGQFRKAKKWYLPVIFSICSCGFMFSVFGWDVQNDFVEAWQQTRIRWKIYIRDLPELNQDSVVFIEGELPPSHHIMSYSLFGPLIIDELFMNPVDWNRYPLIFWIDPRDPDTPDAEKRGDDFVEVHLPSSYYGIRPADRIPISDFKVLRLIGDKLAISGEAADSHVRPERSYYLRDLKRKRFYTYLLDP